jgi:hypothetical protein
MHTIDYIYKADYKKDRDNKKNQQLRLKSLYLVLRFENTFKNFEIFYFCY